MYYYYQEYVGIARQSRFRVICLCYICIYNIYASKRNKKTLYDLKFSNVKKIYGTIKLILWLLGFVSHWLAFSTENLSVV